MSLLKLLEFKAFLEVFYVPSFSWEGCSQELLAETLN